MGVENRDYYRSGSDYTGSMGGWGIEAVPPMVKRLIIANIVVFLLQLFVSREMRPSDVEALWERQGIPARKLTAEQQADRQEQLADYASQHRVSLAQDWLDLQTSKVVRQGQVWRVLTYAFCHDRMNVFHILINMVALYWFGVTLENMYGSREFLLFYLAGAMISGIANILLDLYTGSDNPTVGASGAVMAVLMLFAIHYPRYTIRVFWFIPIEMRWLVVLYVIIDLHPLLLALAGERMFTGIAHAAHLGGLAFGFVYWKFNLRLDRYFQGMKLGKLRWPRRRPALRVYKEDVPRSGRSSLDDQVDDILKKIHEQGEASLTEVERLALQRASERYKQRRN